MREGNIRNIQEAHIKDAGGDMQEGQRRTVEQLVRLIEDGKFTIDDSSIKVVWEAMVNEDRRLDMNDAVRVTEAMTASSFPYFTEKLISKTIIDQYNYALGDVGLLVEETDSKNRKETIVGLDAGEGLEKRGEMEPTTQMHYTQKYVEIKNTKFDKACSLTKELVVMDKTGELIRRAKQIGEKGGLHRHRFIVQKACSLACTATGEAADKSLTINGTARALFSSDHSAWDDVTNDNEDATAFGFAGIKALDILLAGMTDKEGDEIVVMGRQLLVPPELRIQALQLQDSPGEPGTANRNSNPFKGQLIVIPTPILTSAGVYYYGDFPKQTRWQWVWKPTILVLTSNSESYVLSDILQTFKYSYMGGCGNTDYRFVTKGGS